MLEIQCGNDILDLYKIETYTNKEDIRKYIKRTTGFTKKQVIELVDVIFDDNLNVLNPKLTIRCNESNDIFFEKGITQIDDIEKRKIEKIIFGQKARPVSLAFFFMGFILSIFSLHVISFAFFLASFITCIVSWLNYNKMRKVLLILSILFMLGSAGRIFYMNYTYENMMPSYGGTVPVGDYSFDIPNGFTVDEFVTSEIENVKGVSEAAAFNGRIKGKDACLAIRCYNIRNEVNEGFKKMANEYIKKINEKGFAVESKEIGKESAKFIIKTEGLNGIINLFIYDDNAYEVWLYGSSKQEDIYEWASYIDAGTHVVRNAKIIEENLNSWNEE